MRILHAISSVEKSDGGTVTALLGMAGSQAQAGLDVKVISPVNPDSDTTVAPELEAAGVTLCPLIGVTGRLRRHPEMRERIDGLLQTTDVVHIHALWEQIQHTTARRTRAAGVPYVISPHGMLDPWSLSQSRWKKTAYLALRARQNLRHAAAIHFTTETERDLARSFWHGNQARVEPLGVDFETLTRPYPPNLGLRKRYGLPGGPVLLYFGRLHPKKQPDVLIEAFARALQQATPNQKTSPKRPSLVLVGPGDPAYVRELKNLAQRLDLGQAAVFAGPLAGEDRVAALRSADLFCLPSQQENFGLAVAESIAAGTPVLISDQVNIYREIVAGGIGWATPPTLDGFTLKLSALLDQPALLQEAARRAEPFAAEHYTWPRLAERWVGHYRTLAGSPAATTQG